MLITEADTVDEHTVSVVNLSGDEDVTPNYRANKPDVEDVASYVNKEWVYQPQCRGVA